MALSEQEQSFAEPAIKIIQNRWPDIWKVLDKTQPSSTMEFIEGGEHPSFSVSGIQLASTYDPEAEAQLQASTINENEEEAWVYGVGMGYLPRYLLAQRTTLKHLNVVIMNKAVFLTLLHWIDQSDWLDNPRLQLHLPNVDTKPAHSYAVTAPCLWIPDPEASPLRDRIWSELNAAEDRLFWKNKQAGLLDQIKENIEYIDQDGDVAELFGSAPVTGTSTERSVIVAAAGPTLDLVLDNIKTEVAKGAPLIAVDAALKTLITAGITPDILLSIDFKEGILSFFEVLPTSLNSCTLVYFPVVSGKVLKAWPSRRLTAYPYPAPLYNDIEKTYPKGKLHSSGSVIHPAVDLAVKMGASKICLAGADFAFPLDRTHSKDTAINQSLSEGTIARPMVKSGNGQMIESHANLIGYLRDLEDYIQHQKGICFINWCREGAAIAGTEYVPQD